MILGPWETEEKYVELSRIFYDIERSSMTRVECVKAIAIVRESFSDDPNALELGSFWIESLLEVA